MGEKKGEKVGAGVGGSRLVVVVAVVLVLLARDAVKTNKHNRKVVYNIYTFDRHRSLPCCCTFQPYSERI